jgi:hypothetical protein
LIVNGYKDIENRNWPTRFRGWFLVHAGKNWDKAYDPKGELGYIPLVDLFASAAELRPPRDLPRGGIVGLARITDCVTRHNSQYFSGPYGFVIAEAHSLPFTPLRGRLGFFQVDNGLVRWSE